MKPAWEFTDSDGPLLTWLIRWLIRWLGLTALLGAWAVRFIAWAGERLRQWDLSEKDPSF